MDKEPKFLARITKENDKKALKSLYTCLKKNNDKKLLYRLRKFVSLAYAFGDTENYVEYERFIHRLVSPGSIVLYYNGDMLFGYNLNKPFVI